MNRPYLHLMQITDGWQAIFAFQVFHRHPEDWLRMRWGFNAGALVEEALDRNKLFIESQAISEMEFRSGIQPTMTFALRGVNLPGNGLQMGLLGKISAETEQEAQKNGLSYARRLFSTFANDFILIPAETCVDYERLIGKTLLSSEQSNIAQLQRGSVLIPSQSGRHVLPGLWQTSAHANEIIWRALFTMPCQAMFSIQIQPAFFYEGERKKLLELEHQTLKPDQAVELTAGYIPWIENLIKRRLATWKRFFILQIHVITDGDLDEHLLYSIGPLLTRGSSEAPLPGFQIKWPDSKQTKQSWLKNILFLDFHSASRIEDLADLDEAFAVFRFPYLPEAGLPGANFIAYDKKSLPRQMEQG